MIPFIEKKTLKWVNQERRARHLPPLKKLPKGRRTDVDGCVIANAFLDSGGAEIWISRQSRIGDEKVSPPWYARLLAFEFDFMMKPFHIGEPVLIYAKDEMNIFEKSRLRYQTAKAEREIRREQEEVRRQRDIEFQARLKEQKRIEVEQREERLARAQEAKEMALALAADMGDIIMSGEREYNVLVIPIPEGSKAAQQYANAAFN